MYWCLQKKTLHFLLKGVLCSTEIVIALGYRVMSVLEDCFLFIQLFAGLYLLNFLLIFERENQGLYVQSVENKQVMLVQGGEVLLRVNSKWSTAGVKN